MRKELVKLGLATAASLALASAAHAADSVWDPANTPTEQLQQPLDITVYYSPTCGCCGSWMDHLTKHGFNVMRVATADMEAVKREHGLPAGMGSCHTAVIGGYVVEGHVPAADIKDVVKNRPENIAGLSVPEMPVGTPGMEMGSRKDPFAVMAFDKQGHASTYRFYQDY